MRINPIYLVATLSLTACLQEPEDEVTSSTEQAIAASCSFTMNLTGKSTLQRFSLPRTFYSDHPECYSVGLTITTGSHDWHANVSWQGENLDASDEATCEHAELKANFYRVINGSPSLYTSSDDVGVWDYSEHHYCCVGLPTQSCVEPEANSAGLAAGRQYLILGNARDNLSGEQQNFDIDLTPQ